MKRILSGCLSVLMAATLLVSAASARDFDDVQGHWGQQAISQVSDWGIFEGTGGNNFSPEMTTTRGMFVKVLAMTAQKLGHYEPATQEQAFSDVSGDAYYAPYVAWADENGLVMGVGDGRFLPDDQITREQMCLVMARFLKQFVQEDLSAYESQETAFVDKDLIHDYAVKEVSACVALGLLTGIPQDGGVAIRPDQPASRAEVATIVVRLVQAVENWGEQPPEETVPPQETEDPDGGAGGGGVLPPEETVKPEEPTEEEKAEEAQVAGYLTTMLENYRNSAFLPTTDQEVQDCMAILMGCVEDALAQREAGQFLDKDYIQTRYADEIDQLKADYNKLTEDQLNQINNVVVRLGTTEEIYTVMDYFGVQIA